MSDAQEAFQAAVNKYLNANDYMPERLKRQLTERADDPRNIASRDGLRDAIDTSALSPGAFEGLTNSLADTQEEVDQWLTELWAYVYEDGPEPE